MQNLEQIIKPFSFFNYEEVNLQGYSAVNDVVLESLPIPEGFKGIIKDNDVIFTTTGTAKLNYVIKRASGSSAKFRQGIFSDDSGFINKILHEGDRVQITIHTVGTGIIDAIWDGEIQQIRRIDRRNTSPPEEDEL